MSSLRRHESIEFQIAPMPSGMLAVRTALVTTSPRAGRQLTGRLETIRFADFPYDAGIAYLAKRIRNQIAGACLEPTL